MKFVKKLIILCVFFTFAGCSKAQNNGFSIATTFPATDYIASQLTKDMNVKVTNYAANAPEPHEVEISSKNASKIIESDLIIYLPNSQSAIDKIANNFTNDNTIKWAGGLHPWLDPKNATQLINEIYKKLKDKIDNKDLLEKNYNNLTEKLNTVLQKYNELKNTKQKTFIDTHNAFGDLANTYGLYEVSITGADEEAEPSLNKIKKIKNTIFDNKIKTVFYESDDDKEIAQKIATQTNCKLEKLNNFEQSGSDYFDVLNSNLSNLLNALE